MIRQISEGAEEDIPTNAPLARGKEVDLCMFVDSNYDGDKWTRRFMTRFMIYLKISLINWYSVKQLTRVTSVFGTEFVAMKVRVETKCAIQYMLKMMGIPRSGALYFYGDNLSVIHNTSKLESALKKKCNVGAYHALHESVAMGESLTGHVRSEDNQADLLTKVITGQKRRHHVPLILYDIYYGVT